MKVTPENEPALQSRRAANADEDDTNTRDSHTTRARENDRTRNKSSEQRTHPGDRGARTQNNDCHQSASCTTCRQTDDVRATEWVARDRLEDTPGDSKRCADSNRCEHARQAHRLNKVDTQEIVPGSAVSQKTTERVTGTQPVVPQSHRING